MLLKVTKDNMMQQNLEYINVSLPTGRSVILMLIQKEVGGAGLKTSENQNENTN